ncbi:MAG: ATP-dependent RecD-like DNA helicase [Oscillospiraceae bacterium]|nr:ATP-dependent RecD-like DNA helicase [Oscillospiraceae bacterium]
MGQRQTVEGTVHSVIFQNEENGYTVLRLTAEGNEEITVVGCIPYAAAGESMTVTGVWAEHAVHGRQMQAESVERRLPEEENALLAYLSSGILKGVGPATAARLVARFGGDTLQVIEDAPERLRTVKGITAKRATEISQAFRALTGLRRVTEFFARYELPVQLAMRLYRVYGTQALTKLKDNPYLLSGAAYGVDFSAVDEIALAMGFGGDDPCRTEAAILYELRHNLGNGHVFLPRNKLSPATAQLLDVPDEQVELALDKLTESGAVVQEKIAGVEACYLRAFYEAETYVADKLAQLRKFPVERGVRIDRVIGEMEAAQGITYAPRQRQAVELAAREGVILLTGGPGTGKTTSVRAIVALFDRMGFQTLLLAPTGRAAMRMSEVTGRDAQTIHRCLGMSFNELTGEVTFRKGEQEPLETDAVIVDEMSMVDLELMHSLLRAVRPGCRLVLVGDPDQLASVGAGNVFSDLIRSETIPTVALHTVFRQAEQSAIIRSAHAVNRGESPDLANREGDFFFLCRRAPDRVVQTVVELCRERLPKNMGIRTEEIQVISPTRKGICGTENLNRALQEALNPPRPGCRQKIWGSMVFREGDRVMQNHNNYDVTWEKEDGTEGTGVFNGDVGVIREIDPSGEQITVAFDDRVSVYSPEMLGQLDMAYAVTVHKAQGSEYRAVVLVTVPCAPGLMVRGVLYTAITRARSLLILVGDDTVPGAMAIDDRRQRRYSGLRRRLTQQQD